MTNILCALSYVQVFYTFFIVSFQPLNFWQTFDFVCCVCVGGGRCFWHFVGMETHENKLQYLLVGAKQAPLSSLPVCWHMTSVNGSIREVWVGELGLVLEEGEIKSNKKGIYIVKHQLKTEH